MADGRQAEPVTVRVSFVEGDADDHIHNVTSPRPDRFVVEQLTPEGRAVSSVLAPPFVAPGERTPRIGDRGRLPGLDLTVDWTIRSYPGRSPRRWTQVIVDGVEVDGESDRKDVDLAIDVSLSDFCFFITGAAEMRNLAGPIAMSGSLGALSALHWVVAQPGWPRSAATDPLGCRLVLASAAALAE